MAALSAILGGSGLLTAAPDRLPYEQAARYAGGTTWAVARPSTVEELSATVAYAVRNGVRVVPQSGNTGLVSGSNPDPTGEELVLSLDRMRAPLAIDEVDRTVRAMAGTRLSELNTALAEYGLWMPIDLGSDPMVGGMVSTNTGGARFIRYGGMRQRVLALTVVLADEQGTVVELGTGLRKDNSRLDLRQLFVGSCGALGVVAGATLEAARLPAQSCTVLLVPTRPEDCDALLTWAERRFGDFVSAFEGMSQAAMRAALDHVPGLRNPFAGGEVPPYAILLELASTVPYESFPLDVLVENDLAALFEADKPLLQDALFGDGPSLWRMRHSMSEGIRAKGSVAGFDLSFPRGGLFAFRKDAQRLLDEQFPGAALHDFGHIGDGGVHFSIVLPNDGARMYEPLEQAITELAVVGHGASFSGEHGIGRKNQALYDRYTPNAVQALSGRVVDAFATHRFGAARFGLDPGAESCKAPGN